MNRFGTKLKTLRKHKKLSQVQLGTLLGVAHSHIGGMERGERLPSVPMLIKIADIFGVTTDQLVRDELELDE